MTEPPVDGSDVHPVHIEAGEPRQEWCDRCLKPAALTFGVLAVEADGVTEVGEASGCRDCGTGVFADGVQG